LTVSGELYKRWWQERVDEKNKRQMHRDELDIQGSTLKAHVQLNIIEMFSHCLATHIIASFLVASIP